MRSPDPMGGILPQVNKSLNVQKIAVLRRNGIGDLLTCIPMLYECKLLYPFAKLTLIIEERAHDCAKMIQSPPWDELWVLEKGNKYLSAFKMASLLRAQKFDLVVAAKSKAMKLQSLLLGMSGALNKRAVCHFPKKWYEWGINEPVLLEKVKKFDHQSLQTMALIQDTPQISPHHWPTFKIVPREVTSPLASIYVNLSNNRETSKLSPVQIKQSFQKLQRPFRLVLGGLSHERATAEKWHTLLSKLPYLKIDIRLSDQFEGTCALLFQSDLVITGDGGLMHMAAACQRPLIAIFGKTWIKRWHPLSSQAQVLYHPHRVDALDPELIASAIEIFTREREDAITRN